MNSIMKSKVLAIKSTYLILLLMVCGWATPAPGQQRPEYVPQGVPVRRLPKTFRTRDSKENDFVEVGSKTNSPVRHDGRVEKASYNENVSVSGGELRPLRDMATARYQPEAQLPWTYRLKNLKWQDFEDRLTVIWGDRVRGTVLDREQRLLRLYLPPGHTAPGASMKFDRLSGDVTYEGAPHRKAGFHRLMNAIDQPGENSQVKVIDVSTVDPKVVNQVVALYQDDGDPFEEGVQQPERFQQPDGGQQRPEGVELPSDMGMTPQEFATQLKTQVPDLNVGFTVRINPETNSIIIETTDEEDRKKILAFIESIQERREPITSRAIQLYNENAEELIDRVQQMYEGTLRGVHGDALINASPSSNSLIILGQKSALDALEKLIRDFDGQLPEGEGPDAGADKPELSDIEKGYARFALRYVSVIEAERIVQALFNQNTNNNSTESAPALRVTTSADQRSNTLTVVASQRFLRRAEAIIKDMDVPPGEKKAERVLQVFKIKNLPAADFGVILQDTLNGQLQNQQTRTVNDSNLNNNAIGGGGGGNNFQDNQPVIPSTLMRLRQEDGTLAEVAVDFTDVRINPNSVNNTLTVVAPVEAMEVIADIIDELDRLPDLFSEVKVIPVIHGDASEILATIDQIFNGTGGQGGIGGGGGGLNGGLSDLPLQSSGGDGTSLVNIRFAVNQRINTIIASGSSSDLKLVEDLISRLDEPDREDRVTVIYRLSNASVNDVNNALTTYLEGRNTFNTTSPLAGNVQNGNGVTAGRRQIAIAIEPASNQLMVTARPEYIPEIDALIQRLDRRPPMVKVKAQIIQVDLTQLENFGVEFGLQDSSIFDAGLTDTIGTGFVGLDQPAGQLLSDLGVGRVSSVAGVPGFVLSAGDDSLNFVLRFLKQKGCANVLFSPEIMTVENLEGRFNQGANILRQGGTNATVGVVTQDLTPTDIGITLAITPRVSPDGMIVMFVDVSNTSLGSEADGTVIGQDATGNQIVSRPINQTVAQSTIMARSGQTVAISGLFQEDKSQTITSIPFLGDLPVIGPLFQSVENTASRSELLIILTPYIVDGEDDIAALNKDDFDRMHWCKRDVAELYGTTSYQGVPYREQATKVYYPDSDPLGQNPVFNGDTQPVSIEQQEDQWDGEGEQIFPPARNENRWRNQNQGLDSRNQDRGFGNEFDGGSSTRSKLPEPTSRMDRDRTAMRQADFPPENNRYEGRRNRDYRDQRDNQDWQNDGFYQNDDREFVEPPHPTDNRRRFDSNPVGFNRQGGTKRRVISHYPASPRNASRVYQRENFTPESRSSTFSRR